MAATPKEVNVFTLNYDNVIVTQKVEDSDDVVITGLEFEPFCRAIKTSLGSDRGAEIADEFLKSIVKKLNRLNKDKNKDEEKNILEVENLEKGETIIPIKGSIGFKLGETPDEVRKIVASLIWYARNELVARANLSEVTLPFDYFLFKQERDFSKYYSTVLRAIKDDKVKVFNLYCFSNDYSTLPNTGPKLNEVVSELVSTNSNSLIAVNIPEVVRTYVYKRNFYELEKLLARNKAKSTEQKVMTTAYEEHRTAASTSSSTLPKQEQPEETAGPSKKKSRNPFRRKKR